MHENKPSRTDLVIAAIFALSLLSVLAPIPRPRAVSETPWLAEFFTTAALAGILTFHAITDQAFVSRLFTVRDALSKWIVRCLALFAFWSLASVVWARSPYMSVHHAMLWGEYILVFLYFRERFSSAHNYRLVSYTFGIVAVMLGLLAIIDYATLPDFTVLEGVIRLRYGAYAELLVAVIPVLAALGICAPKMKGRLLLSSAAAAGWAAVMLSLSKGAFIAGIAGFGIMFVGIIIFASRYRRAALVSFAGWVVLTIGVQAAFSILSPIPATVDYISGKADATRGTTMARISVWKFGSRMVAEHPVVGVGADNFGIAFNEARAHYRIDHPTDPNDEPVSDNLVERGHNEMFQVTAELGIVGLVFFLAPFALFAWQFARRFLTDSRHIPPVLWAAGGGMTAFFISSMVSSFGFRVAENGVAFFVVFALAVVELKKLGTRDAEPFAADAGISGMRFAGVGLAAFLLLSLITLGTRGYAERCVYAADRESDKAAALDLYARAYAVDPSYARAYLRRSGRHYADEEFGAAASDLRRAIDGGCGVVITYSALAASYEKAGDAENVERTFDEAFRIFPRSVFLRVRYAMYLETAGHQARSDAQMLIARSIDKRQANGWFNVFKIGSVRAFYAAQQDPEIAAPVDLLPDGAVLEYLDKPPGEAPQ